MSVLSRTSIPLEPSVSEEAVAMGSRCINIARIHIVFILDKQNRNFGLRVGTLGSVRRFLSIVDDCAGIPAGCSTDLTYYPPATGCVNGLIYVSSKGVGRHGVPPNRIHRIHPHILEFRTLELHTCCISDIIKHKIESTWL